MAVYVDNSCIPWRGKRWCHMLADSLFELHQFSASLGLSRGWFHKNASYPHYDVTVEVRDRALIHGALLGDRATIIDCARRLKSELGDTVQQRKRVFISKQRIDAGSRQADFFQPADSMISLGSFTQRGSFGLLPADRIELATDA